jgi:hypothetical protein
MMSEMIEGCEPPIHVYTWQEEYPGEVDPPPDWPCQCGERTWLQALGLSEWPEAEE